jgi:hypothetical protein
MIVRYVIGAGVLVVLVLLWVAFQEIGNRMRALHGECRMDSLRCLGCMASGRCKAQALSAFPARRPKR